MSSESSRDVRKEEIFTEKIVFKNSKGLNLSGDFYPASNRSIIVMCHGLAYDRSTSGRFDKAAEVFNKEGFNVFKFDFSGCGESDYGILTIESQIDDLRSALKFLTSRGLDRIGLLGNSFGGFISLKVCDKRISAMVIWAPVTNVASCPENYYGHEGLEQLGKEGKITKLRTGTLREKTDISAKLFEGWKNIDQKELLSSVKIPILIIHGDKDTRVPLDDSKNAIKYLSTESELQIIGDTGHHLEEQLNIVISKTADWFNTHLPR